MLPTPDLNVDSALDGAANITIQSLSATRLLDVWEYAAALTPLQRPLALLSASCGQPAAWIAQWSIGQRNSALLTLREALFGTRMESIATCPACNAKMELDFTLSQIRVEALRNVDVLQLEHEGKQYTVTFRLPNSFDLMAVGRLNDDTAAQYAILARCVSVQCDDHPLDVEALPAQLLSTVAETIDACDPQAAMELNGVCSECSTAYSLFFDIAAFLWHEIEHWAQYTLREIHLLARAYGWREQDTLALSAWRRQCYLQMMGS